MDGESSIHNSLGLKGYCFSDELVSQLGTYMREAEADSACNENLAHGWDCKPIHRDQERVGVGWVRGLKSAAADLPQGLKAHLFSPSNARVRNPSAAADLSARQPRVPPLHVFAARTRSGRNDSKREGEFASAASSRPTPFGGLRASSGQALRTMKPSVEWAIRGSLRLK